MFPFQISLELRMTKVTATTGAVRRAKLQPHRRHNLPRYTTGKIGIKWNNWKRSASLLPITGSILQHVRRTLVSQCFIKTSKHWRKMKTAGDGAEWGPKGRKSRRNAESAGGLKGFPLFSALRMAYPDTVILLIVDRKKMKNSSPIQSWVNYCVFGDAVWSFIVYE